MRSRNFTRFMILGLTTLAFFATGCSKVPPGYVGIKVNQYGNQRGVEDFPIQTGRVNYNPFTEDVYKFPTFLQTVVWTRDANEGRQDIDESITFNSIEGAVVNADISIAYSFMAEMVPHIFVEFRKPAEEITNVYVRSKVRNAFSRNASTMKVVDIFGEQKRSLELTVLGELQEELAPKGIKFDMVSIVGALRVDENVEASINAVITAAQKAIEAQNKIVQATAEADQRIEAARGDSTAIMIVAQAQANANLLVAPTLTPTLVNSQWIDQWDGVQPQAVGVGGALIQLPAGSK